MKNLPEMTIVSDAITIRALRAFLSEIFSLGGASWTEMDGKLVVMDFDPTVAFERLAQTVEAEVRADLAAEQAS